MKSSRNMTMQLSGLLLAELKTMLALFLNYFPHVTPENAVAYALVFHVIFNQFLLRTKMKL